MEIKPFKAVRFDAEVVGDVGSCISPPYDVISPVQQQQLYQKNDYNIVRIIKGKEEVSDDQSNNQYTRAAEYLSEWMQKGALKLDSCESIYPYVQDFEIAGKQVQRFSFIALGKLEKFGKTVKGHEKTLDDPIIDRLKLQKATAAKFGLVFMLYEDEGKIAEGITEKIVRQEPFIDFTDDQNVRHRLFAITAQDEIKQIIKMMADKSCIIADGHHRYATSLAYARESSNQAAQYQMFAFANMCHEGLVILSTHRLVGNLKNFDSEKLILELGKNFEISSYDFDCLEGKAKAKQKMLTQMKDEFNRDKSAFGIFSGEGAFRVAVLKNEQAMDSIVTDKSQAWKSLDVSVLHKLILEELLGIGETQLASGENLKYIKDSDLAIDESITNIDDGEKQVVFFMNPVRIQQLKEVTDAGEKMPQKSTYFYPKVFTGLTISKL